MTLQITSSSLVRRRRLPGWSYHHFAYILCEAFPRFGSISKHDRLQMMASKLVGCRPNISAYTRGRSLPVASSPCWSCMHVQHSSYSAYSFAVQSACARQLRNDIAFWLCWSDHFPNQPHLRTTLLGIWLERLQCGCLYASKFDFQWMTLGQLFQKLVTVKRGMGHWTYGIVSHPTLVLPV